MSAICPACSAPQDAGLLCSACCDRLERELGNVPALVVELDITISRQARIGTQQGKGGLASEKANINWGAASVRDDLTNTLTTWARDVRPDRISMLLNGMNTSASASRFLLHEIDAIRRHQAVDELVDEIHDAITQARRAIDRPADKVYLGQCLVENEEQVTCMAELYARPEARDTTCRDCGISHDVAERRAWLLQRAEDMIVTVKEASSYLGEVGGIRISQASIRGYLHRGKLAYRPGVVNGIRLGDLLAVVVDEGERRSA